MNTMQNFTGNDLRAMGFEPGAHFGPMLALAKRLHSAGKSRDEIRDACAALVPETPEVLPLKERGATRWSLYLDPVTEDIDANNNALSVISSMNTLMRTPVLRGGCVLPDAMPAGPHGTITVGGVAVSEGIHPGFHSADICCSMYLTLYGHLESPKEILDQVHAGTHFGPGGRDEFEPSDALMARIMDNPLTAPLADTARSHMGTQGDGNHFAYVGSLASTGHRCLITHHGSRGFGAKLYKAGMRLAEKHRRRISPDTLSANAWIPADTEDAALYWDALQIVRAWTKENHACIHSLVEAAPLMTFWNEHNFVFRKDDGLFYHAKGATPSGFKWADDATPVSIIPLNMAQPILLVAPTTPRTGDNFGFAPHGAGRNYSRTEHSRRGIADVDTETAGLDVRFFCGRADMSELPSAYKNADTVRADIDLHGLAKVVDAVLPYGSIMAGEHDHNAPWKKKRRETRKAERKAARAEAHAKLMKIENPRKETPE